jgi:hypothetical protein
VTEDQLAAMASWLRSTPLPQVIADALRNGDLDPNDGIELFHYINDQRSKDDELETTS